MPEGIDANTLIVSLVYIVPLITLVISIVTFTNAVKERHGRTAAEAISIKKDIENLSDQVKDMQEQLEEAIKGYHSNEKRIVTLETKMKAVEARVKTLEGHHMTK